MKFVAIIIIPSVFFMQFLLDRFSSDPLTSRAQKRDKEVAPSGHQVVLVTFSSLVSKYAIHRNCFGDLYLWFEGLFLEIDPTAHPAPTSAPQSPPLHIAEAVRTPCSQRSPSHRCPSLPPPPPPPPPHRCTPPPPVAVHPPLRSLPHFTPLQLS